MKKLFFLLLAGLLIGCGVVEEGQNSSCAFSSAELYDPLAGGMMSLQLGSGGLGDQSL